MKLETIECCVCHKQMFDLTKQVVIDARSFNKQTGDWTHSDCLTNKGDSK